MEKIDKAIEILQAFKEGKILEVKDAYLNHCNKLNIADCPNYNFDFEHMRYEILKQPTYRPYANAEEFLKASKEHGPYLHLLGTNGYYLSIEIHEDYITFKIFSTTHSCTETVKILYKYLKNNYKWQDGASCEILEE